LQVQGARELLSRIGYLVYMPSRKNSRPRVRHDSRKWALQALKEAGVGTPMSTSAVLAKASALSGEKIPYYSINQALKTLLRRKQLTAQRKGHELVYRLLAPTKASLVPSPPESPISPEPSSPPLVHGVPGGSEVIAPAVLSAPLLHKIGPGEIALLHVGETHVETAANIEGQLVLKKHPRPT